MHTTGVQCLCTSNTHVQRTPQSWQYTDDDCVEHSSGGLKGWSARKILGVSRPLLINHGLSKLTLKENFDRIVYGDIARAQMRPFLPQYQTKIVLQHGM